jgi:hypothetical protein
MKFPPKVILTFFILTLCCGTNTAFAQSTSTTKKDTTYLPVDSTKFFAFTENDFPYGNSGTLFPLFNKLDNFQDFHPRQASLGNAGSPEKYIGFYGPPTTAFNRGRKSFYYFGFSPENRTFYSSERAYTKLQYIVGQKQELDVHVIHGHPFGKNCNVAFGFDRVRSTGFYQRQNTNNTSVDLDGWYRAPGRRYAMLADIYWTTENVAENGGISNDSNFDFGNQLDRHLVAVNLSAAETRQRLRGAWYKEYWSFGAIADTISDKSDSTGIRTSIRPSWAVVHISSISDEKYAYNDGNPTEGFYANIYRDSLNAHDSTYIWRVENGLWLERFDAGENKSTRLLSGKIGVREEAGRLVNDTIRLKFQNIFLDGRIKLASKNKWWDAAILQGWYVVNGTNKNDYSAAIDTKTKALTKFHLYAFLSAQATLTQPDFIFRHYSGNFFRWQNDFSQTGITSVKAGIGKEKSITSGFRISAGWIQYTNPTYFDATLLPVQSQQSVQAFFAQLVWNTGTKHFKARNNITWNSIPGNSPVRLPELIVRESLYADFFLFKSALQMQVGLDATWYSSYFADAYNPNISQFYVQDSKSIGNYVFLDPFLSIKVKPVRVFVKADHLNAGWFGRTYYQVPHYPGNDFALKFGMSWVFND